jgi:HlyD family secretion protein
MQQAMDIPVTRLWWQRPHVKVVATVIGGIFVILAAVFLSKGASERSLRVPIASVTIAAATRTTFRDVVPFHGTLAPKDIVYLDALAGGQVEHVMAQPGDRVSAGQPIIIFRNAQLELDVLNNAGRLVESITQVQTFETQLENNRATNEKALADIGYNITSLEHTVARIDPLLAKGFYTKREAEVVHDQLDHYRNLRAVQIATNRQQELLRKQQLPHLRAEQDSLRRSLEATHAQLDNLTVRAPVTGTITQIDLKIGQNRNRGERLAEITTDAGFLVSADVDEFYLPRVSLGQSASVTLGGKLFPLRVIRVHPEVKNGAFVVELGFREGDSPVGFAPGAAAEGELALGSDRRALVLPAGAFLQASGDTLFVLDPDGKSAHRRAVRFGRRTPNQVEILSGLAAGERAVISDYSTYGRIDRIDFAS